LYNIIICSLSEVDGLYNLRELSRGLTLPQVKSSPLLQSFIIPVL